MSKAKSAGFSPERLARIDRFIGERYIRPGRLPCAQVVITRRGETVHEATLGFQDVERGTALRDDAVFRIYSMTKPITSVVLMSLVEEGRIALDDPVTKWIPEWANLGVYAVGIDGLYATRPLARPMQVVDLLRHTSGLTYSFQNRTNVDAAYRRLKLEHFHGDYDLEGFVHGLAKAPLEFSPGEAWNYSVSTDVVGYLVQKVTGQKLSQVFRERIFEPLKMVDTGFHFRDDQRERIASIYAATPTGGMTPYTDPSILASFEPPRFESGGGGLVSTAADYVRFTRMLLNGGELDGARIIAPKTLKLMTANHLPEGKDLTQLSVSLFSESTYAGVGFGLGFAVVGDAARTLLAGSTGEYFWGGMASTAFWVDPVEEITAVLMTQLLPSSTYVIRRELRSLVYAALMEPNG